MKTRITAILFLMILFAWGNTHAQAPHKFNYQAVVRNAGGAPVTQGSTVSFRFSLAKQRNFATSVYQETHQKTVTNSAGLITLEIGTGNVVFGSFPSAPDLSRDSFFLKVETDITGGTNYTEMSVTQLISVPYALHSGFSSLSAHSGSSDSADRLSSGSTINASIISQSGASTGQVLTWNGSRWAPATPFTGWSIQGNSGTDSNNHYLGSSDNRPLILRTNNQNRVKITSTGLVGIGTTSPTKLLTVNGDILVNGITIGRGSGQRTTNIAIGADALGTGNTGFYNLAIGNSALASNTSGTRNMAIGYNSLSAMTIGAGNLAIGDNALFNATTSSYNIGIGTAALNKTTTGGSNIAIGFSSMYSNTTGSSNTAIGYATLEDNTTGAQNIAVGNSALMSNTTGSSNTALGLYSANSNTTGIENTATGMFASRFNQTGEGNAAFGYYALYSNKGSFNTAIGAQAAYNPASGQFNTSVGYNAGPTGVHRYAAAIGANANVINSRTMAFGRQDSVNRWCFGRTFVGNGAFQVGSSSTDGNGAYLTTGGTWTNTSDVNLKSDITPVNGTDLLAKIKQLEITRWRYNGTNEYHIGPMAQQFYQLFQTGVDDKGISTVDPAGIALKGIQEQQKQIEALRAENEQLKQAIQELKQMIIQKPAVNGN